MFYFFLTAMTVSKDPRYAKYFQMIKVVSFNVAKQTNYLNFLIYVCCISLQTSADVASEQNFHTRRVLLGCNKKSKLHSTFKADLRASTSALSLSLSFILLPWLLVLLSQGVPPGALRSKMAAEGLDPDLLE